MTTALITPPLIIMTLEWARGRDIIPKLVFYIGVLLALYLAGGVYAMPLALLLFMTGWIHNSKALSMIMDGKDNRGEKGAPIRTWLTNKIYGYFWPPTYVPLFYHGNRIWGLIYSFLTYFYLPFIPLCYWYASKVNVMFYDLPMWLRRALYRCSMIDPELRVERVDIAEALKGLSVGTVFMLIIMWGWV